MKYTVQKVDGQEHSAHRRAGLLCWLIKGFTPEYDEGLRIEFKENHDMNSCLNRLPLCLRLMEVDYQDRGAFLERFSRSEESVIRGLDCVDSVDRVEKLTSEI